MMFKAALWRSFFVLSFLLASAGMSSLRAQQTTGTILGTV